MRAAVCLGGIEYDKTAVTSAETIRLGASIMGEMMEHHWVTSLHTSYRSHQLFKSCVINNTSIPTALFGDSGQSQDINDGDLFPRHTIHLKCLSEVLIHSNFTFKRTEQEIIFELGDPFIGKLQVVFSSALLVRLYAPPCNINNFGLNRGYIRVLTGGL